VPVAWMLTSSATMAMISFFVAWVRDASPVVRPAVIMTDRDEAQIAALKAVYPRSNINLCTWHVLRVIRSHLITHEFPAFRDKIKKWITTDDLGVFLTLWDEISTDPSLPQSTVKYLKDNWLPVFHLWSKVLRKNRSIFEEGDTNMLIESYVHAFFLLIR
jgi:MULE transposase domain